MSIEKWRKDFTRVVERHREEGWGWRYDGLESWTTDAIFAQLRELGVDTAVERFHEQAVAAGRIRVLRDEWDNQFLKAKKDTGFWQDFPMLAVPVLWERLTPELLCPELFDERLHRVIKAQDEGESLPDEDGFPADLAAAHALARYLQAFPVPQRPDRYREVVEASYYDYGGWLVELVESQGPSYPDAIVQIADVMSDCVHAVEFQRELAIALACAGRREEAIARAQANIIRFPDDIWIRILAGDVFDQLDDQSEAIRLWFEGLSMARNLFDWEGAYERLEGACDQAGRGAELQEAVKKHPKPVPPPMPRRTIAHRPPQIDRPAEVPARVKKIGRNDPCPCGSGKKYKKCCMPQ